MNIYKYDKNNPTQRRRLTWERSWQNGVFHFVKTNRLYENGFILHKRDLTSTPLTIITNRSILDVAAALDAPLAGEISLKWDDFSPS